MNNVDRQKTAVIIEDDPEIRAVVVEVFESAGLRTIAVDNGIDGVEAVKTHQPSVTTLDINLDGIDGFETARRIRSISSTFIIMLSGLSEEADVVLGLGAGADEYVVKPFRPRELRARIEAALRRPRIENTVAISTSEPAEAEPARTDLSPSAPVATPSSESDQWVAHRDLRLNVATRTALVADEEIDLTRTEFDLLATMVRAPRRVWGRDVLMRTVWGDGWAADEHLVEVHVGNMRRKLAKAGGGASFIRTVRGVGYRMEEPGSV